MYNRIIGFLAFFACSILERAASHHEEVPINSHHQDISIEKTFWKAKMKGSYRSVLVKNRRHPAIFLQSREGGVEGEQRRRGGSRRRWMGEGEEDGGGRRVRKRRRKEGEEEEE